MCKVPIHPHWYSEYYNFSLILYWLNHLMMYKVILDIYYFQVKFSEAYQCVLSCLRLFFSPTRFYLIQKFVKCFGGFNLLCFHREKSSSWEQNSHFCNWIFMKSIYLQTPHFILYPRSYFLIFLLSYLNYASSSPSFYVQPCFFLVSTIMVTVKGSDREELSQSFIRTEGQLQNGDWMKVVYLWVHTRVIRNDWFVSLYIPNLMP